ncbi:MAG: hypothetical protein IJM50_07010 [Lachnospiraceae bacterium]|nr:hypothetical protein [Lachnospiraceae bacterium]
MINAFKRSFITCWAVRFIAAAFIGFIWVRNIGRDDPVWVPVLMTVLAAGAGYFISKLLGQMTAAAENTNRLGILHMQLDPEAFLQSYSGIPERLKKGTKDHAVASSYVADGYDASGDHKKALEVLDEGFEGVSFEKQQALEGLYRGNRLGYLVNLGDMEEAKKEAAKIEALISSCKKTNPGLSESLASVLMLRRARISIEEGVKIDPNWLKGLLPNANFKLRELEILRTVSENALLRNDRKEAAESLKKIAAGSGKTFFASWAKDQLHRHSL